MTISDLVFDKNLQFVLNHKEKTRSRQRITDFVSLSGNAIELSGCNTKSICDFVNSGSKKPFQLVILNTQKSERTPGEIVSSKTIFTSSEGIIFEDGKILFSTDNGLYVSIDEYNYLQSNGELNGNEFFAKSVNKDKDVLSLWKYQIRRSSEARKDKGINIMYLTIGSIQWLMKDAKDKNKKSMVTSPLFLCPIKEDFNSKEVPRFTIIQPRLNVNSTLARVIKEEFSIDLFEGISSNISFSDLEDKIDLIEKKLDAVREIKFQKNRIHICLLDSSNEMICQAVERRLDNIVACPLISVFSGAETYLQKYDNQIRSSIYPLPADDTQIEVIQKIIAGESLNVTASPGSGKSVTAVNAAVNLLINKKSVCIMSEKAAANEVVLNYFKKIGLETFCLPIDNRTTVKSVISRIKVSISKVNVYVDTDEAKAVIESYKEVENELKKFNKIYDNIPELGTNLYSLIGEAIVYNDYKCEDYFNISTSKYQKLKRKVKELQSQYIDTISITEWNSYLESGSTGDDEQDEMLDEAICELEKMGIDIINLVKNIDIEKSRVAQVVVSQLARLIANFYIDEYDLKSFGNKKLKMLYKKLLEMSNAMREVSISFVKQELCQIIKEAMNNNKFVELLDRLATSRISLQDFFHKYGSEIIKFCPIIIGTPCALVQYDSLNVFDAIIVDESSQMPFTNILPFLMNQRQLIVFGDPQQLSITDFYLSSRDYEKKDGEEFDLSETDKSLLHVVQSKLPSCQLLYHYRSKTEHLITISNHYCYDGLLNVAPDYYFGRENLPEELGCELVELNNVEISQKGANLTEAREIVNRVIEIRKNHPDKTVGIITLNEVQQSGINDVIDEFVDKDSSLAELLYLNGEKLFLRTLENAQGKEADVIFISIGHYRRNSNGSINKQISILNKEGYSNRLNVLFTRAREKVVVTISFSYKELKNSDKGVFRLYEYLRYIDTGEYEDMVNSNSDVIDKYNEILVSKISELLHNHDVYGRVGNRDLTVDVGLVRSNDKHYDIGLLFPNKALSANTICTKVAVLERAGWNILPLSPITCFTKPDKFSSQLSKELEEKMKFNSKCLTNYATENKPSVLFTLDDLEVKPECLESAITIKEFLDVNYILAYENVFPKEIREADDKNIIKQVKAGNNLAKIKLYLLKLKQFVEENRLNDLLNNVVELYKKESVVSYLYAQLLRVRANPQDANLINKLLQEAKECGIKII